MSSNPYKSNTTFEERKKETTLIRSKYPEKYPVIVQRSVKDTELKDIDRNKFLVPCDIPVLDFLNILRKRVHNMNEDKSLFFYVGTGKLITMTQPCSALYDLEKDEDGYLYIFYQGENTFG